MRIFTFLTLFISVLSTYGQNRNFHRCYTKEAIDHLQSQHPNYLNQVNIFFNQMNTPRASRSFADSIYTVRVVFHVLYTNATQNIDDSLIYNQMVIMNRDFRRLNADTTLTRTEFKSVAADAKIEFELATEDPDGNPTSGITRTQGTPGGFGYSPFNDNAKSTALGGKNPWPTDRYLNVWVCNLFGGIVLGYAYPPTGTPNWDVNSFQDSSKQGVVLHYQAVGSNNPDPLDATVDQGRTAVHEIGHYLGLRHVWGDGDCTEDDGFDDTPNMSSSSEQGCSYTKNTCIDLPVNLPDQIENYMDYSDESCLNMFTKQQVDLMLNMLTTARPGVISKTRSLYPTSVNDYSKITLNVFPNPNNGTFSISSQNKLSINEISLFDFNGKSIDFEALQTSANEIQLKNSNLGKGIYLISLKNGNASSHQKIVVY
jgi:hypothetical protein